MLKDVRESIKNGLCDWIKGSHPEVPITPDEIVLEVPPQREFGDLACPIAFSLAKSLRRSPRQIATELCDEIKACPPGVSRMEVGGAGYLNLFLRRGSFVNELASGLERGVALEERPGKVIVEHTNINPNKAAHIGHLRNAVLGDTLVRVLRALGYTVEAQNYIDDTGVQVADVVVGFIEIEKKTLAEIEAVPEPFDYYCWDLYAKVGEWYAEDEARLDVRAQTLHAVEKGESPVAEIASHVATRIVRAHLATMARLGIRYDLLPWESDILKGQFWQAAFDMLKEKGAVRLEDEGKNQGCWVMSLKDADDFAEMDDPDKILVRSNGTVTYTGKDIAYQLWKFGLLGRDFAYKRFADELWTTTSGKGDADAPAFGKGARVYNVIDVRQSYPQKVVKHALAALGFEGQAANSIHFDYEMVSLSAAAAEAMGVGTGNAKAVEMSGRKGIGVKADDLLNAVLERAVDAVNEEKADGMGQEERERTAQLVSVAAVRYFMVKYGRTRLIAFDFDDALNLRGETGPYLLYSYVRFSSIFRKLTEAGLWDENEAADYVEKLVKDARAERGEDVDPFSEFLDFADWDLMIEVGRLQDVLETALVDLELASIAKFAFNVAQKANSFYHRCHILREPDPVRQRVLIAVSYIFRQALGRLLELMGIETLGRM